MNGCKLSSDTVSAYVKAKITDENEIALIKEECIEKTGIVLNITI